MSAFTRLVVFPMLMLSMSALLIAQQVDSSAWKEYSYPAYGFAAKAPNPPHEIGTSSGIQYGLYWDEDAHTVVNLMVERGPIDCTAWEKWAKSTFKHSGPKNAFKYPSSGIGSPVMAYSAAGRITIVNGETAVEADAPRNAMQDGYQLHECLNGRLYHFESGWKKGEKKPEIVGDVIKTFRILPSEATK